VEQHSTRVISHAQLMQPAAATADMVTPYSPYLAQHPRHMSNCSVSLSSGKKEWTTGAEDPKCSDPAGSKHCGFIRDCSL